jgi:hypothetical protein
MALLSPWPTAAPRWTTRRFRPAYPSHPGARDKYDASSADKACDVDLINPVLEGKEGGECLLHAIQLEQGN